MMDAEDIPRIPDREKRFDEITVDCYGDYEVFSAFEVYLTEALRIPFAATWSAPGTAQAEHVIVLGIVDTEEYKVAQLNVRRSNGDVYEVPADQLWAEDVTSVNAIVLDDYRAYVENGLPFDDYEE